eukprot:scaffold1425_cov333-Prasinococcus_capsulatus_cf.AAC.6
MSASPAHAAKLPRAAVRPARVCAGATCRPARARAAATHLGMPQRLARKSTPAQPNPRAAQTAGLGAPRRTNTPQDHPKKHLII